MIFYDFLKGVAHLDMAGVWQMPFHRWFHLQVKAAMSTCYWATEDTPLPMGMLVSAATLVDQDPPKVRRLGATCACDGANMSTPSSLSHEIGVFPSMITFETA